MSKKYKLAPMEPTPEMIDAAREHHEGEAYLPISVYKAMLAAAPAVQGEPVAWLEGNLSMIGMIPSYMDLCAQSVMIHTIGKPKTFNPVWPLYVHPSNAPDVAGLVEALEEIINPVRFMQERLEEGDRLNGMVAVQLAEDASYLRGIAEAALATYRKQRGES